MIEVEPNNQFCAFAVHECFAALVKAAALLGDPIPEDSIDAQRDEFMFGILHWAAPAGNA